MIGHYNYWIVVLLMVVGFYILMSRKNLIKKLIGLNLFQTAVILLYMTMGKVEGGTAAILTNDPHEVYSNPIPHVLMLTAIVVGVATISVGLALVVRIQEAYGTIEEDEIHLRDGDPHE